MKTQFQITRGVWGLAVKPSQCRWLFSTVYKHQAFPVPPSIQIFTVFERQNLKNKDEKGAKEGAASITFQRDMEIRKIGGLCMDKCFHNCQWLVTGPLKLYMCTHMRGGGGGGGGVSCMYLSINRCVHIQNTGKM